ncbi:alpha/beta hydrolase [Microbacterium sp. LRZ72]|uniref:alpha/beta fold hydrolase n=1 Tax=Microbacterium sp. LRZ72 TaxID=2942481 RepID=UPI0029A9250F|nr:alpha/beta fold hydrolase [Microbacterium sp. LRZ72]MDX2376537.1 alpha/beta hydrolase [Microbacterium sp. LRZ72]
MTRIHRVLRPATARAPAFSLAYVRTGPRSQTPIVVIPGGPGLASIEPYRALRRHAARGGLDVIMIEHRGVGHSRRDESGRPLPFSAMWIREVIDDIAAVLDDQGVTSAFIVGSSYGSYLASSFAARHPDRVAGMILDSTLQSTSVLTLERERIRELFWDDDDIAHAVRRLHATGGGGPHLLEVIRAAFELDGERLVRPLVAARLAGTRGLTWKALEMYAGRDESIVRIPYHYEFAIAGAIGFRELHYGAPPDGHPLDPAGTYAALAHRFPRFDGEPFDLLEESRAFTWPVVLLVGARDLRTPPDAARRVASGLPDATIVGIDNGHSALDTHPAVLLNAMRHLAAGRHHRLPALASRLDRLPRPSLAGRLPSWLRAGVRLEGASRR